MSPLPLWGRVRVGAADNGSAGLEFCRVAVQVMVWKEVYCHAKFVYPCPHPNPSLLLRKQYLSLRERYVSQRDKHCSRSDKYCLRSKREGLVHWIVNTP